MTEKLMAVVLNLLSYGYDVTISEVHPEDTVRIAVRKRTNSGQIFQATWSFTTYISKPYTWESLVLIGLKEASQHAFEKCVAG